MRRHCAVPIWGLITLCALTMTIAAHAAVPRVITYQGRLLNSSGLPVSDGIYSIRLALYDSPTAGSTLWDNGVRSVQITGGLFSYALGDSTALPSTLFATDTLCWLGIKVGNDPELVPRVKLTSTAYAFKSLWSDSSGYALAIANGSVSSPSIMDGSIASSDLANQVVDSTKLADNAVATTRIADNAVTAAKVLDEPGVAANLESGPLTVSSTTMQDLVTVTITIPAPGYILLDGMAYGETYATDGQNIGLVQIDETEGGPVMIPGATLFGGFNMQTSNGKLWPIYASRTYYKSAAGAYTFRLEAAVSSGQGPGALVEINSRILRALYVPTSYGSVISYLSARDATGIDAAAVVGNQSDNGAIRVDLRELELKAAKAQAEADKLQRQILEEKLRQSQQQLQK
jgi:hypothetical protein